MEVEFEDRRFGRLCNSKRDLERAHGRRRARLIARRLQVLQAADNLEDLRHAPGRHHELTANRAGTFTVDLDGPYRLAFRPSAVPPPAKPDGGIDWRAVTAVTVIGIIDPH